MEVVNTVGRRKAAVARVFVKPGTGNITINQKELAVYFPLNILQYEVKQPLLVTETTENFDVVINLVGGGIKGQAEAARMGIARALCEINPEYRPVLKKNGFLTRDSREVERKKPGQPGARRKSCTTFSGRMQGKTEKLQFQRTAGFAFGFVYFEF